MFDPKYENCEGSDVCELYEFNKKRCLKYKMNYEKFRIESFKGWPIPWINVREMAASGFYYVGEDDKVKCNFCNIKLCSWQAEDTPAVQHEKWAPYCPLINDEKTRNIPLVYKKKCTQPPPNDENGAGVAPSTV
jgi:hypothetical protein